MHQGRVLEQGVEMHRLVARALGAARPAGAGHGVRARCTADTKRPLDLRHERNVCLVSATLERPISQPSDMQAM